ncbi:MAG: flavin monoamine oxidase family protein [Candidatus Binataceae bacterium]
MVWVGAVKDYDVVIIGGGFAGITAARELTSRGLRSVILEARNRLGGRTLTREFAGVSIELGGGSIHWSQPHVWSELVRYGLKIKSDRAPNPRVWLRSCGLGDASAIERASSIVAQQLPVLFCEGASIVRPYDRNWHWPLENVDRITVQDRIDELDLPLDCKEFLSAIVSSSCSAPCSEVSLLWIQHAFALANWNTRTLVEALEGYCLDDGMSALLDAMRASSSTSTDIRLSTTVVSINQSTSGVSVRTNSGVVFSAKAAVVTVPINALSRIAFSPPLRPEKTDLSLERHAGCGFKFWALLANVDPTFAAIATVGPISQITSQCTTAEGTVVAAFGQDARCFDIGSRTAVEENIRAFVPKARVIDVMFHDWTLDPLSEGTWAAPRPGQISRYLYESQEAEGRLFFAGGDIAVGWLGTIDGAIESGLRAADELSRALAKSKNS